MIPFNKPYITGREELYIKDCLEKGHIHGDGQYTKKINKFIEEKFNTKKALMTTSCSSALDIAGILMDLKEGDEVIMPSFTFVSTANAVVLRGARPVFAEINEDTLNIDPRDIENKITNHTKAIFPVHYAGVSCDMESIMNIAKKYNLIVVEDAAQGVNAKYKGKHLGTIGDIGCYSFHETKNYSSGEGGAILINYDNDLSKRAETIREKGTNRSQFFRGEVDKYTWVDEGSSYLPADILAAFLWAQFEKLNKIQEMRKKVYDSYHFELEILDKQGKLKLPIIPECCESNYHIFYILLNSEKERDNLMYKLKEKGIGAVFHYIPLHESTMGQKFGYKLGDFRITEELSKRILRLPMYPELKTQQIEYIVKNIKYILH
ncbi:dTDP-4-amino-4,6-dideoxygalactose transaminase [Clostridium botulinum]|uniref:dTDP-4-amino-4,6-dideoxygalactose transaminase n=1 Tax=Clostridium botulinum TaxID=1491 RepID=A0A6G4HSS0_CLOBO|nr:dTDP-4-amino-4,6-dideoxygalactose transaminase [Clostridium botulinum]MBD5588055.1 dTDP-4-amino-4,6-dideoxygalactose transaminase [Clostridium botulinum]MBO0571324.1 dTDP-4-amino-4,6-dideoxygalactose transaminase [Clostridium botulinum]MBO0583152.1 dTDP-4-amino-4,6-dideoxygalactose transaminase [Clostridium botulinum]NFJ62316.1 dTDP-4-amino-4,6-dideoxygalactose transaminase [Clostridium botulinum]NFJ67801.1 dTDP-4-amino-4,6-dideoxygalactose transaminase [Clostridium botulinum]